MVVEPLESDHLRTGEVGQVVEVVGMERSIPTCGVVTSGTRQSGRLDMWGGDFWD